MQRKLLPGLDHRPWLSEEREEPGRESSNFGNERRDGRGRVRVTLGTRHPHANSGGWCWRYRLVAAYALGRKLRTDEHVDHINGVIDDDRLSNLRLLTPEVHGRYHAWLFEIAGCRGPDGRFTEYRPKHVTVEQACRLGPVISAREIDEGTWRPLASTLSAACSTDRFVDETCIFRPSAKVPSGRFKVNAHEPAHRRPRRSHA